MRNTKIICTIGPASQEKDVIRKLAKAGMNVARLNFSHGSHESLLKIINNIKEVNKELGTNVAILQDLKGPEIRTHDFSGGVRELLKGSFVNIHMDEVIGDCLNFSVTYPGLINDVTVGDSILLDDGLIELIVIDKKSDYIVTEVQNTGFIKNKKGVNIPNINLNMPFLSEKDIKDIKFGLEHNLDFIAPSFVRRKEDVLELLELIGNQRETVGIIAKIENQEGVQKIDEILELVDGIIIARGDLGVEIPIEDVPVVQKNLINRCCELGKTVATATHMLDSMQKYPRPTRAEVSDVANAVLDGTDALTLSGETAAGDYPVEALKMMAKIATRLEDEIDYEVAMTKAMESSRNTVSGAIGLTVSDTAFDAGAKAIVVTTFTGKTAKEVSRFSPICPIFAVTECVETARQLALNWGVHPVLVENPKNDEDLIKAGIKHAKVTLGLEKDDLVLVTGGVPEHAKEFEKTNCLRVATIE
jgi:pyruvate kinase